MFGKTPEDFTNGWVKDRVTSVGMNYMGDSKFNGNGNGIKLGGDGSGGSSRGIHTVRNCVVFGCNISGSVKGFDQNSHQGGNVLENCVAWANGYNYMFENGATTKNCLSMCVVAGKANKNPGEIIGGSITNCNFTSDGGDLIYNKTPGTLTPADFITIAESDAKAPRQADGSLPNNGFAQLKSSSPFYGQGMGLAY